MTFHWTLVNLPGTIVLKKNLPLPITNSALALVELSAHLSSLGYGFIYLQLSLVYAISTAVSLWEQLPYCVPKTPCPCSHSPTLDLNLSTSSSVIVPEPWEEGVCYRYSV